MADSPASRTYRCDRCEVLPDPLPDGPLLLHLWFPAGHTRARLLAALRGRGRELLAHDDGRVDLPVAAGALGETVSAIDALLSSVETADVRALAKPRGTAPDAADLGAVRSWAQFAAMVESRWLLAMLGEGRLTSAFQPIVHAADPARTFAHEMLLRGVAHDGALMPPGRLFEAARSAGLLFQLDLAARRAAIAAAARHRPDGCIFINFTPTSIYDPTTCLRSTVAAIDDAGIAHDRIVFEVIESDRTVDVSHLRRILDEYRRAGFRVALDDLGAGYSSLNLVHQLRPDFIKLDRALAHGVHADRHQAMVAATLLDLAARMEVPTIAEGVEMPEDFAWLRAHGATYVQGWLIARPAAAPPPLTPIAVPAIAEREAFGGVALPVA